eukprot:m.11113 g.11113  ORF g.11113 m.11113 type:complete len:308 (-) comp2816_c0_seq1:227-1150(-)
MHDQFLTRDVWAGEDTSAVNANGYLDIAAYEFAAHFDTASASQRINPFVRPTANWSDDEDSNDTDVDESELLFPISRRTSYDVNNGAGSRRVSRCLAPAPPTPAPHDSDYINLDAVEDLLTNHPVEFYDHLSPSGGDNDDTASDWRTVPTADGVRTACRQILLEVDDDRTKHTVGRAAADLFVEVIHLGASALRQGAYRDDDLNHCVDAAQQAGPALLAATGLKGHAEVEQLLAVLQSPYKLHAVLSFHEHTALLSTLVWCFRNLMLSLVLPSRSPSPIHHAAKSEVLLESSIHLMGAVNTNDGGRW